MALVAGLIVAAVAIAGCSVGFVGRHRVVFGPAPVVVYPQYTPPPPPPVYYPPPVAVAPTPYDVQLQRLVAPVALYPDPLLAQVLSGATYPAQIQAAAQWLAVNPYPTEAMIDAQFWPDSVKALAHYPEVLNYLSSNIAWTQSLGAAYINEPQALTEAIQDLRAQAVADGSLVNTPQQIIEQNGGTIYILPANPAVLYVPAYDPMVIYTDYAPIQFIGPGVAVGIWLNGAIDWQTGLFFAGDWRAGWGWGPRGWYIGPGFHRYFAARHPWRRDVRWGRAPVFNRGHFGAPGNMRGRDFRPVRVRPRDDHR